MDIDQINDSLKSLALVAGIRNKEMTEMINGLRVRYDPRVERFCVEQTGGYWGRPHEVLRFITN